MTYCQDEKYWDEGVPLEVFVAIETVQESSDQLGDQLIQRRA